MRHNGVGPAGAGRASTLPSTLFGAPVARGPIAPDDGVSQPLVSRKRPHLTLDADTRRARLDVAGVARFSIVDGEHVTVDANPNATDSEIGVWLLGSVTALLLGQQGRFALHATTVALPASAVAVSGAIGSGKSTTSLALVGRGHRLVADDVSPLTIVEGAALVEPFGRPVHVWPVTYAALGVAAPPEARALPRSGKLEVPAMPGRPAEVGAVVVIRPSVTAVEVSIDRVDPMSAVRLLASQAYRRGLLQRLWPGEVLRWSAELAGVVATFVVTRPAAGWTAPAVADAVEEAVAEVRSAASS